MKRTQFLCLGIASLLILVLSAQGASQTITTIVGGGVGDGGLATDARLLSPSAIFVNEQGVLFIADPNNHRVRRVDPSGVISTVIGTGIPGNSGRNGQALSTELNAPQGVWQSTEGDLFIADSGNHRVLKVDNGGRVAVFAGGGSSGFSGDGGPANQASLDSPMGLFTDPHRRSSTS